jgi:hypothetical protein
MTERQYRGRSTCGSVPRFVDALSLLGIYAREVCSGCMLAMYALVCACWDQCSGAAEEQAVSCWLSLLGKGRALDVLGSRDEHPPRLLTAVFPSPGMGRTRQAGLLAVYLRTAWRLGEPRAQHEAEARALAAAVGQGLVQAGRAHIRLEQPLEPGVPLWRWVWTNAWRTGGCGAVVQGPVAAALTTKSTEVMVPPVLLRVRRTVRLKTCPRGGRH